MISEYTSLDDLNRIFNTLASCMNEALMVVNRKGDLIKVNDSAFEMFGLEKEPNRLEMAKYYGVFHLDEKTLYTQSELPSQRALKGEVIKGEIIFIRNSSKPNGVYASTNAEAILNDKNEIIGAVVIATNITDQKVREIELQRNKELLEQSQQMAQIGYWEVDLVENTVHWSNETRKIHEVDDDFVPNLEEGINFYDEHSKPLITEVVQKAIVENIGWDVKLGIISAKGNHRWVRSIGKPYKGKDKVEKILGVFQDITEDKSAEDKLIQNEKEIKALNAQLEEKIELRTKELSKTKQDYKKLYNEAPDMMASVEAKTLTITSCNQTLCDILGYTKKELIHQSFLILYHPDSHNEVFAAIENFKLNGKIKTPRLYLKKKDGDKLLVTLNATVIRDNNGRLLETNSTWRDITQLEKVESELKILNSELEHRVIERTEELQKVNEELEEFAYITTHDLKAPISNIKGHLGILEIEMEESQDPIVAKTIHWIKDSIEKAEANIQSIIKVAQLREPASKITTDINLNDIINQVITDIKTDIHIENVQIHYFKTELFVKFNLKNMYSILYNIITNSIKYKQLNLDPIIKIKVFDQNEYTCVIISDNGLGMDLETNGDKLFGMFKRLHDHIEGNGIGLYLVKRMVEAAGGKIEVKSQPNVGTAFTLYFKKQ